MLKRITVEALKEAIVDALRRHEAEGPVSLRPISGLTLTFCKNVAEGLFLTACPTLVFVMQGLKRITHVADDFIVSEGQTVLVTNMIPTFVRLEPQCDGGPHISLAIDIKMDLFSKIKADLHSGRNASPPQHASGPGSIADEFVVDCVGRLMKAAEATSSHPWLHESILWELHVWLLLGRHSKETVSLCEAASSQSRLAGVAAVLQTEYRGRIPISRLAEIAGMGHTTFHTQFKRAFSVTPRQYQKRLRLIEARRLMVEEAQNASSAAFKVGYESASQFTREYRRFFKLSPKRDVQRIKRETCMPDEA
jgi:AraC-like DNA-binding protein